MSNNNTPSKAEALEAAKALFYSCGAGEVAAGLFVTVHNFISGAPVALRMLTEAELATCRDSTGRVPFIWGLAKFCEVNRLRIDSPEVNAHIGIFATPTGAAPDHFADASKMIPAADGHQCFHWSGWQSNPAGPRTSVQSAGQPIAASTAERVAAIEREFVALEDLPAFIRRLQAEVREHRGAAGVAADESRGQPTLREDAMYAMGYQRGAKDGWNFCISDDQEGFARTQASTEHVRVLRDTRAADESTRAPDGELPEPEAWRGVDLVDVGVGTARDVVLRWEKLDERDEPLFTAEQMRAYRASGERPSAPAPDDRCPTCGGNDKDMPCAYPDEGMHGCPRDRRLSAAMLAARATHEPQPPMRHIPGVRVELLARAGSAPASAPLVKLLKKARDGLSNGLWDYGPGQDEHEQCNALIAEIDAFLSGGSPEPGDSE